MSITKDLERGLIFMPIFVWQHTTQKVGGCKVLFLHPVSAGPWDRSFCVKEVNMARYANVAKSYIVTNYLSTLTEKLFALSLTGMFLFIVIGCALTAGV